MQGDSSPVIDPEVLLSLRADLDGQEPVTVEKVSRSQRKLGVARKYRRHRWRLLELMTNTRVPVIDASIVMDMLKMFRVLEYHWNYHRKEMAPGRKVFFSYRFIFYQFAHELGHPEITGPQHLLKNVKFSRFQFDSYRRACKYTNFTCFDQ